MPFDREAFMQRQERAHELGEAALRRLLPIAQRDTGQSRRVARFLLGLYNGDRYPFDLTELRGLDQAIFDDCIRVLTMDSMARQEVHAYFPDGGHIWNKLAEDHGVPDQRRLRLILDQLRNKGVASFGGEAKLDEEIRHARASTWPDKT